METKYKKLPQNKSKIDDVLSCTTADLRSKLRRGSKNFNKTEKSDFFLQALNNSSSLKNVTSFSKYSLAKDYKEQIISLQDQIVLFKTYFNKKENEFISMKVAYNKLVEENNKNLKIINKILSNVNVHRHVNENSNDRFLIEDIETMKETYVLNSLKMEVHKLRDQIIVKEQEIEDLKKQTKISKFIGIQDEYKTVCDEYIKLDRNYINLQGKYDELKLNLDQVLEEREALKNSLSKYKTLNDDMKRKLKFYQNETISAEFIQEDMKDKLIFTKYSQKFLKNRIKEVETEKVDLNNKVNLYEKYKHEREQLESMISNLNKKFNFAVFEKEQLQKKLKIRENFKAKIQEISEDKNKENKEELTENSDLTNMMKCEDSKRKILLESKKSVALKNLKSTIIN